MLKKDKTLYKKSRYIGLCLQKPTCRDFGTPDRNRTYAPGSGGRCSIHWATGAYEMVQFSISHFFQKAKHFFEKVKKLFSKKSLTFPVMDDIIAYVDTNRHLKMWYAGMAELADALDSGSNGRKAVQVQVLLPAPYRVFITDLMLWTLDFLCFFWRAGISPALLRYAGIYSTATPCLVSEI